MQRLGPRWRDAWVIGLVLCLTWAAGLPLAGAQEVLPVPALTGRVVDQADVLQPGDEQALQNKLAAFEGKHGSQIAILTVRTTRPEDIFSYANRVAQTWKLGRPGVGDGVLIVVAKDDKRARIEVARTLEGAIPDLAARRILREVLEPRFAKGDFAGGLNGAVDRLTALIEGEALPPPAQGDANDAPEGMVEVLLPVFIGTLVAGAVLSRWMGRGGSFLASAGGGALAGLLVSSAVIGVIFGMAVFLFTSAAAARTGFSGLGPTRGWGRGARRAHHGAGWPIVLGGHGWGAGSGWGGGGGLGGDFGGGGFSSGGGGDFSGGGASGSWGD